MKKITLLFAISIISICAFSQSNSDSIAIVSGQIVKVSPPISKVEQPISNEVFINEFDKINKDIQNLEQAIDELKIKLIKMKNRKEAYRKIKVARGL